MKYYDLTAPAAAGMWEYRTTCERYSYNNRSRHQCAAIQHIFYTQIGPVLGLAAALYPGPQS